MEKLEKICEILNECASNGLRVGQTMSNVFDFIAKDGYDPFFIEDEKLVEYMEKYLD